ncbi:MAG: coproporphyrinogen dehydrogenase HemZ [Lachnospiraceae bacterium]|nr:coproporphyrinogen dehydrogenase HemZ [Lachnospiraceae bacterium]
MIKLICNSERNEYDIRPLVMSFFPGETVEYIIEDSAQIEGMLHKIRSHELEDRNSGRVIYLLLEDTNIRICTNGKDKSEAGSKPDVEYRADSAYISYEINNADSVCAQGFIYEDIEYAAVPDSKKYRDDLKRLIYRILSRAAGKGNRWGTLTGVRPSKIAMGYLKEGLSRGEIIDKMREEYYCSEEKASLCADVAQNELRILDRINYETGYSVYIGIPFCPTVCNYCSFSSISLEGLKDGAALMRDYLRALEKECAAAAGLFRDKRLSSIYVGGGTPTALDEECLAWLMSIIRDNFDVDGVYEFTVEAGRPDSINEKKLAILKSAGVTRISINPQTMKPETLLLMGRKHTTGQVREVFRLARDMHFDNINMDLIAGLMGESSGDFKNTISAIGELAPDSFTVHSLVVKRASKYRLQCENDGLAACGCDTGADAVEKMLDMAAEFAGNAGYIPYYMYRQKNKSGLGSNNVLENVGYSKPGREGIYNIVIMEEKQTIAACGAGASTKLVGFGGRIGRCENVKNVMQYIDRIDEMIERKARLLKAF